MGRNDNTSAIIDNLLRFLAAGGMLTTLLLAPNALQVFDKPLQRYLNKLDKRARQREYRRIIYNMKKNGLIKYETRDYEHGIQLTKSGRKRAETADFVRLAIPRPSKWDKHWRMVFFDIPEAQKSSRDRLSHKLRALGFVQLQRSVWVHPFPCRPEIESVATQLNVERYITYIETSYIDASNELKKRFSTIL